MNKSSTNTISVIFDSDKLKKQTEKRLSSIKVANLYKEIGDTNKYFRMMMCGRKLGFTKYENGVLRLTEAKFCQLRMCPTCAWNLSRRRTKDMFNILAEPEHKDKRFLFITLTVRNCKAEELPETLDMMFKGLRSWTKDGNHYLAKRVLGIVQKLEITYNKSKKTYHPHFHLFCEVEKAYFKDEKLYIEAPELSKKWADTLGLDYLPSCNIQAVRKNDTKSVLETVKYSAKDSEYSLSADVFKVFESALARRRLFELKGSFKKTMQRLNLNMDKMIEAPEVVEVPNNPALVKYFLEWSFGGYKLVEETVLVETNTENLAGTALLMGA